MTTIRTHNKRAKRLPYSAFVRKRHQAWKAIQYARMYGMGPRGLREMVQTMGRFTHELDLTRETVERFRDKMFPHQRGALEGVVGSNPEYVLPKRLGKTMQTFPGANFAEQEARALAWHRQMLDEARARGDTVIEHTYADATIIVKGEEE